MAIPARKRFKIHPLVYFVALVAVVAGVALWFMTRPKEEAEPYQTQAVTVGAITKQVSASGTLQALVTVDVGSQVSGQIEAVLVDFDDQVTRGQILARIDPQTQQQRLESSRAELESAQVSIETAQANLNQTMANAGVTQADYNRTKSLFESGIVSKQALEKAEAQLRSSNAQIQVSQGSVKSAQSRMKQVNNSYNQSKIDLDRTIIYSPITGVVVDRTIDEGSTVAASLNAPVLFKIAQDLSKLELKILVDEADIGQVREGQTVNFTVDAFPEDRFNALITQVRKQPESTNNVVAYVVIAQAENPQLNLLPGMTANAEIVLEQHTGVIRVPSSALRWQPIDPNAPPAPAAGAGGFPGAAAGGGRGGFPGGGGGGFAGGGGGRGGGGGFGAPGGGRGGAAGRGGAGRGGAGRGAQGIMLFDQLNLPPELQARVERVFDDERKERDEIMTRVQRDTQRGATVDREGMTRELRELNEKYSKQAEELLNAQQKAQLQQIRDLPPTQRTPRGQVYVLRDGKPYRIGVGIGVTDGATTQVISRSFRQGDQVIISGGPQPKT